MTGRAGPPESGTATLELVIIAPFMMALFMMIVAFGRYAQTENLVDQASRDAARAATAQNSKEKVPEIIDSVVTETMTDAPSSCRDSVTKDSSATPTAYGLPDPENPTALDSVSVTVTCTLDLSDLAALPLKSVKLTRTFTSPLDRYRGYQ